MTVLIIDVGSSSVRALLFDDAARPIPGAQASRPSGFRTVPPGAATLNPAGLQARTEACIDQVLAHPAAKDIRAVGMATLVGNVLGVDHAGRPLTPIYTYADTRSAADVAFLRNRVDLRAAHQRTGCIVHTAYLPGRLHWLRRTLPGRFTAVTCWLDFGAYLYHRWFGHSLCSYSVASWSGMLNRADLDWDAAWLDTLGLSKNSLPPLTDYDAAQVGLRPVYARRWPALKDVPFYLPVGDGAAANVGSGCVNETHIALTVGTTAALRIVSRAALPSVPDGLWSYRVDAAHHLIGGATSEGGNIFGWARSVLALGDPADLEVALAARTPDSHRLSFLPLLAGERSPGWASGATGAVAGLRLSTTALDLLQAALEGVALRLALIADQLAAVARSDAAIIGGGGALVASRAWAQIMADALDRPLHVTAEEEITARGVAILILRALGLCALDDYPPAIAWTLHPRPAAATALRAARERQADLYRRLIGEGE